MRIHRGLVGLVLMAIMPAAAVMAQSLPATQQANTQPATSQPAAYTTQGVYFVRGGKTLTVELGPIMGATMDQAVLYAYGRTWTQPVASRKQGIKLVADVTAPVVRVPTVFLIVPPGHPNRIMGELVAYPDRGVEWDKKITLYSSGKPEWFNQWAAATGLPVKSVAPADLADAKLAPADEKGKSLLILGRAAAGKDYLDIAKLGGDKKVNVLVLDADWFGGAAGKVSVEPKQMSYGLAEIAKQKWAKPLEFDSHRLPWPGIANRWAWIRDDQGLPLVEAVVSNSIQDHLNQTVMLCYVPWELRLGRDQSADDSLLALSAAVANAGAAVVGGYHGVSVSARPTSLLSLSVGVFASRPLKTLADRPVLSAIVSTDKITDAGPVQLDIIDIRGEQAITEEIREFAEKPARGHSRHLLILGDDKMLDKWEWLKLDREKKTVNRPGVIWMGDDTLPPSTDYQIKLMLKLTELGVQLAPPEKDKEKGATKP